jgi:ribulose bisphosphate carboxylase small subunit
MILRFYLEKKHSQALKENELKCWRGAEIKCYGVDRIDLCQTVHAVIIKPNMEESDYNFWKNTYPSKVAVCVRIQ